MPLITIMDAHTHARTGVIHSWSAIYVVQPDGAAVSVTVQIPSRPRPFRLQTYLSFDPVTANTPRLVSEFVEGLIDGTDLETVELTTTLDDPHPTLRARRGG